MALINIPSSGIWSTIADALNAMFSELFNRTGYVTYTDTQYTIGNPFVVAAGATLPFPNNALVSLDDQLPAGVTDLYSNGQLISDDPRAAYVIRIQFKISNSAQEGAFKLVADISGLQDGSIPILSRSGTLFRGANTEQDISYTELYYSRETFVANGADFLFTSITGISSIYDISYVIGQFHKGRI